MKWFKHMTDSRSGRVLSESMKLFRHSGYAFWFILHEVYGYYYNDVDKDGFFHTSVDFLCKETRIQKKKIVQYFEYFAQKNVLSYHLRGSEISFKIPVFIELAGSWRIRVSDPDVKPCFTLKKKEEEEKEGEGEEEGEKEKNRVLFEAGMKALDYLNEKTKKRFTDLSAIYAMLEKGRTAEECISIIDNKLGDPFFRKNPRLLNPRTLFSPDRFDAYLNEAPAESPAPVSATGSSVSVRLGNGMNVTLGSFFVRKAYRLFLSEQCAHLKSGFMARLSSSGFLDILTGRGDAYILDDCEIAACDDCEFALFFENIHACHASFVEEAADAIKMKVSLVNAVPEEFIGSDVAVEYFERVV